MVHSSNYNRYEFWGRSDAFAGFPSAFTIGPYFNTPIVDPVLGTTSVLSEISMIGSTISDSGTVSLVGPSGVMGMNPVIL